MASSKSFIPQDAVKAYNELNAALERNNEVLGKHFAELQKVAGEFSKVSVSQKDLLAAITRYEQVVRQVNATQTEQARIASQLEKWEQKIAFAKSEEGKRLNQLKVDYQAINRETTIASKMASAYTTTLTKLINAQEQANIAAQKYKETLGVESKEYKNAVADAKRYEQEIAKLEMETGRLTAKKTSMYGATFQLTQVMRELPNFAMDARIGFMSLSNNLPMLVDSFNLLSQTIDKATMKPYGAAGALKMFAKSLLSMNTVMVVASTLLIMFGDKIMEVFTGKVSAAEQAHRDFIKSLEDGSNAVSSNISDLARLRAYLTLLDGEYVTQEDILKSYNETIGNVVGKTDDFATAQQNIIEKGDGYIAVMLQMAAANGILEQATKEVMEAEALREDKKITGWQRLWNSGKIYEAEDYAYTYINAQGEAKGGFDREWRERELGYRYDTSNLSEEDKKRNDELKKQIDEEERLYDRRTRLAQRAYKEMEEAGKLDATNIQIRFSRLLEADEKEQEAIKTAKDSYMDAMKEIKAIAKDYGIENPFNFNRDTDKGGSKSARALKDVFIELDVYDQARAKVVQNMKQNELDMAKTTTSGVLNSFAQREKAIQDYYKNALILSDIDYETAVEQANQKKQKDLERIQSARDANAKIKASDEEKAKRAKELDEEEAKVYANYETAKVKANDEANAAVFEAEQNLKEQLAELWSDKLEIEFGKIDIHEERLKSEIEKAFASAKANAQKSSPLEIVATAVGGDTTRFDNLGTMELEHNERGANLATELDTIAQKMKAIEEAQSGINVSELLAKGLAGTLTDTDSAELDNYQRLTEQKLELERQFAEKKREIEDENANYEIESQEELQKVKSELWSEAITAYMDLMNQLVEQSFEKRLEANEEWAEKENERVDAQVKSEVISEEQAEAQRQAIENQKEQREKEIKRKQAIYEKTYSAFQIGLSTAAAIVKASPNVALMALSAAIGAAQLAAVLATPIPQYAHGTEDHPGGPALVGEAGKHELVVLPDGTLLKTPKRPTLLDLPPHAEVLPDFAKAIPDILTPPTSKDKYSVTIHEDGRLVELTKQNNKLLRRIAAKDTVIVNKQARNYNMRN